MSKGTSRTVLAVNSSTQSVSGTLLDPTAGRILWTGRITYGDVIGPRYGAPDGFITTPQKEVYSPPLMWIEGLSMLLDRLRSEVSPPEIRRIARIAGAGQQHGTAYLRQGAEQMFDADPGLSLPELLEGQFSWDRAPIWMDSTTREQCALLESRLGGPLRVAELTGSIPTERFSLPQILRFAEVQPELYDKTGHICLVSSLICSCFLGRIAPMEPGDGSGMNLMNIRSLDWDPNILAAVEDVAPNLRSRLPAILPSNAIAGPISNYMVTRYGFSSDAQVLPFSGDNPDSLLGMGVYGEASKTDPKPVLSLGTSDTLFALTDELYDPQGSANIMGAVTGGRMALVCFKNGSLARRAMRDAHFPGDDHWVRFDAALRSTVPANNGRFMFPFFMPEITPNTCNLPIVRYFEGLDPQDGAACARAVVEGQFLNLGLQMQRLLGQPKTIRVTGGAAVNREVLRIAADVLNATLELIAQSESGAILTDSVSLGGAIRASATLGHELSSLVQTFCAPSGERIAPRNAGAYDGLRLRFAEAIRTAL
ncbi:MAG: FGGY family carbohydrate kinase [Bdellovibrionota bacterium]